MDEFGLRRVDIRLIEENLKRSVEVSLDIKKKTQVKEIRPEGG